MIQTKYTEIFLKWLPAPDAVCHDTEQVATPLQFAQGRMGIRKEGTRFRNANAQSLKNGSAEFPVNHGNAEVGKRIDDGTRPIRLDVWIAENAGANMPINGLADSLSQHEIVKHGQKV